MILWLERGMAVLRVLSRTPSLPQKNLIVKLARAGAAVVLDIK